MKFTGIYCETYLVNLVWPTILVKRKISVRICVPCE